MPKGNISKKGKKKVGEVGERELLVASEEQNYGVVTKVLGGSRFSVKSSDRISIGRVRGTMRKKKGSNFVSVGSVVLVGLRDFGDGVDIIHVYNVSEIKRLKKMGEIDKNIEEPEVHSTNIITEDIVEATFDFDNI